MKKTFLIDLISCPATFYRVKNTKTQKAEIQKYINWKLRTAFQLTQSHSLRLLIDYS